MVVARTFEELARLPDALVDVELGAALIARDAYVDLDVEKTLAELHALGLGLADAAAGADSDPRAPAPAPDAPDAPDTGEAALRGCVDRVSEAFRQLGFHGNTTDYYDPRNSFLPDVLRRRMGIPVTLCLVWRAMARSAGLDAHGVAFPGHFLCRVNGFADRSRAPRPARPLVVDPFNGCRFIDTKAARALLAQTFGEDGPQLERGFFVAETPRYTLVRMLTNLQNIHAKRGDDARAFLAADRILTLVPDHVPTLRDRAAFATRIGAGEVARADLERVLLVDPGCADAALLRSRIAKLGPPSRLTLH